MCFNVLVSDYLNYLDSILDTNLTSCSTITQPEANLNCKDNFYDYKVVNSMDFNRQLYPFKL